MWYDTPLISAVATLVAATAAAWFAVSQIRNQRRIAKTRATLDIIIKYESDQFYRSAVEAYIYYVRGNISPEDAIGSDDPLVREKSGLLNSFLNFQETIALGISHDTLDKNLFYDYWATSYVDVWNRTTPLIKLQRKRTPKVLVEFEKLAREFARKRNLEFIEI